MSNDYVDFPTALKALRIHYNDFQSRFEQLQQENVELNEQLRISNDRLKLSDEMLTQSSVRLDMLENALLQQQSNNNDSTVLVPESDDFLAKSLYTHMKEATGTELELLEKYVSLMGGELQRSRTNSLSARYVRPRSISNVSHTSSFDPEDESLAPSTPRTPSVNNTMSVTGEGTVVTSPLVLDNDMEISVSDMPDEVIRTQKFEPCNMIRGHLGTIHDCVWHSDEPLLFTAGGDCIVRAWNVNDLLSNKHRRGLATFDPLCVFRGSTDPVLSVAYSELGFVFGSNSNGEVLTFGFDLDNIATPFSPHVSSCPFLLSKIRAHNDTIWAMDVHHSQNMLVTGCSDGSVKYHHIGKNGPEMGQSVTLDSPVVSVQTTPMPLTDPFALVGCKQSATILHLGSGDAVHTYKTNNISTCSFTFGAESSNRIAIGKTNGSLELIDPRNNEISVIRHDHGGAIDRIVHHRNSMSLITCGRDGNLVVLDLRGKNPVRQIIRTTHYSENRDPIMMNIHRDIPLIATVGIDGIVGLYQ
ncbi:hypothetical protein PCE1_001127 [Barthelona sp. PCE]